MNQAIRAIIKKDIRGVTSNKRLFSTILIMPAILAVLLPSIFMVIIHFTPDDPDMQKLMQLLPQAAQEQSVETALAGLLLNSILPLFFLMIPIMAASIMAASSFVGEKEKQTLETLLYCPLPVRQIFRAKVLAAFLLSMVVSLSSFLVMLLVLELEAFFLMGAPLLPGISWAVILLLVSPAVSLIAVTLIVRGSAKAKSMEESQQGAVFLILPVILLAAGQFSGVMLLSVWLLLGLGVLCAVLAWLLLKRALGRFTYETLLK